MVGVVNNFKNLFRFDCICVDCLFKQPNKFEWPDKLKT